MKKHTTIQKANIRVNGIRNKNCKGVRCVTTGKYYASVHDAANAYNVAPSYMSTVINNNKCYKGHKFIFEKDLYKNTDQLAIRIAEVNDENAALKADAMAYRAIMAEREAAEKAARAEEEARLKAEEELRKAEEKRQAKIAKAKAKVERKQKKADRLFADFNAATSELVQAEMELEALLGDEGM